MTDPKKPITYQSAGVDIQKADTLVDSISAIAKKTFRPGVISNIGGFGGLFELSTHYKKPVLVSGTDGVGTKLKIAIELQRFDTIGIDLVAMCANDIVTTGAEPLFFLDYYATGQLDPEHGKNILIGIANGCKAAGMALIGGETAEMPGLYHDRDFDLAGFCVGVVEKEKIIDSTRVRLGDTLIALASSGPHSNGYSLIRKIVAHSGLPLSAPLDNSTLGDILLTPTRIYVKALLTLLSSVDVHAIAHITGGGLVDNLPRVLPIHTQAVIDTKTWQRPAIFDWLQKKGGVDTQEMWHTFNLGVGMVIAVAEKHADKTIQLLAAHGERAWRIGHIEKSAHEEPAVVLTS